MNPEVFIALLREVSPIISDLYTKGGCYKFFKILEAVYPQAEAYYNEDHVITKIDGQYYDISGKVDKANALRMTQEKQDEAETWKTDVKQVLVKMLNESTIKALSDITGISTEEITSAITDEKEVELNLPKGDFFTEEDLKARDKSKYEEGRTVGVEKPIKEKARELGYEINGKGGLDAFLEVHDAKLKEKYSKGSDQRVQDLEKAVETQKKAFEADLETKEGVISTLSAKLLNQRVNNTLLSGMPKETTIDKGDILTLFNASHNIEEYEGDLVVKNGEEILRDPKSTKPIPVSKVFSEWVVDKKYIANPGGRGAGDNDGDPKTGIKADSAEDFQNKWQKENPGKSTASLEYSEAYAAWRKDQKAA